MKQAIYTPDASADHQGNTATSPVYTVIKAQAENRKDRLPPIPEWLSYVDDERRNISSSPFNTANTAD